jgi:2-oxoglutarate ferredoxin oxidoreductase subunit alpha
MDAINEATNDLSVEANAGGRLQVSLALVGSGGAGVVTAAEVILRAAAKAGLYGVLTKSFGPQIRGGETCAFVTLSNRPVETQADRCDILLAIDWLNVARFAWELPLTDNSLALSGVAGEDVPEIIADTGAECLSVDIGAITSVHKTARPNMIAVGLVMQMIGLAPKAVEQVITDRLSRKGSEAMQASLDAVRFGADAATDLPSRYMLSKPTGENVERWVMSGNQAAGLGAIRGGVRFVAAYPITPATEILEWMSPRLPKVGGQLMQAEDELASINMIIGGSYGGIPSLTATSGPGLALMIESIGLAVASEVPIVIADVMRGGPSTGIPTKSEQADLNIAVYGLPGDAPHVVTAARSIGDAATTMQWSVELAEAMQIPVIFLSDQLIGQGVAIIDPPENPGFQASRLLPDNLADGYERYVDTPSGVSPMAIPGMSGGQYTADGLEHNPRGTPSSGMQDHVTQSEKRARKVLDFDYGNHWADIEGKVDGDTDLTIVTWGSTAGPVSQAVAQLDPDGRRIRIIVLRLIAPAQPARLREALAGSKNILVAEQSFSGQLFGYLKANWDLPPNAQTFHRPGPQIIRADEIRKSLEGVLS